MTDVYKGGGPAAFYKGAVPRALKSALNIALQFFLYDSLKRIANVSPDDLKVTRGRVFCRCGTGSCGTSLSLKQLRVTACEPRRDRPRPSATFD